MWSTNNSSETKQKFVCINCGHSTHELFKKYSNALKTAFCDKCGQVADKYIEFESLIILIDAMLLSQKAFRHMIFNAKFKLYWKLSLVLLLLESFALWRKKRSEGPGPNDLVHEKGFYICSLQNLVDYLIITSLLLLLSTIMDAQNVFNTGLKEYTLTLLKAVSISNLSKIFILPILVWRDNTTDLGRGIHYVLVMGHHLCSLVLVYSVVSGTNGAAKRWMATFIVLPSYLFKEYLKHAVSIYIEAYF